MPVCKVVFLLPQKDVEVNSISEVRNGLEKFVGSRS